MPLQLALLGAAVVGQQLEGRAPLLELHFPVQHDRSWDHNEVRPPVTPVHQASNSSCVLTGVTKAKHITSLSVFPNSALLNLEVRRGAVFSHLCAAGQLQLMRAN